MSCFVFWFSLFSFFSFILPSPLFFCPASPRPDSFSSPPPARGRPKREKGKKRWGKVENEERTKRKRTERRTDRKKEGHVKLLLLLLELPCATQELTHANTCLRVTCGQLRQSVQCSALGMTRNRSWQDWPHKLCESRRAHLRHLRSHSFTHCGGISRSLSPLKNKKGTAVRNRMFCIFGISKGSKITLSMHGPRALPILTLPAR